MCSGSPSAPRPTTQPHKLESCGRRLRAAPLAAVFCGAGRSAGPALCQPAVVQGRVADVGSGKRCNLKWLLPPAVVALSILVIK
jgi:hypothetical protein